MSHRSIRDGAGDGYGDRTSEVCVAPAPRPLRYTGLWRAVPRFTPLGMWAALAASPLVVAAVAAPPTIVAQAAPSPSQRPLSRRPPPTRRARRICSWLVAACERVHTSQCCRRLLMLYARVGNRPSVSARRPRPAGSGTGLRTHARTGGRTSRMRRPRSCRHAVPDATPPACHRLHVLPRSPCGQVPTLGACPVHGRASRHR